MVMKRKVQIRQHIFNGIATAFILLFCYAATSKIIDFENFQVQLAQSPMLSAFSDELSFAVPISEFLIVILFMIRRYKFTAMFLSFTIMIMFTAYIYMILNYSPYVPCSCGGVLEKLGWKEHMIFNIAFILMAVVAIIIYPQEKLIGTNTITDYEN